MRAHVDALKAMLAPLGYPVHFVEVPAPATYPYVLLWAGVGAPGLEQAVDDVRQDIDTTLGVTGVGSSPESALALLEKVRTVFAPGGHHATVVVTGYQTTLRLYDSRTVTLDVDVTLSGTSRHPAYGVDLYRLIATPA